MARVRGSFYGVVPVLWILYTNFTVLLAKEVVLLDSTKTTDRLDWQTYTSRSSTTSWREISSYMGDQLVRSYYVCDVGQEGGVNNWLRTPYIPRGDANRIYIEIKFTMRECSQYPSTLQQCYTTFNLLYYEAESDFANGGMPTWDDQTYTHIDTIAADKTYVSTHPGTMDLVNTELKSIPVTRRGVYFAFNDRGACVSIQSVRVYAIICPNITKNYAFFPDTPTGPYLSSIVQQHGSCVSNAAMAVEPSYLCKADGSWNYPSGRCECMPGYQPDGAGMKKCLACRPGTYKWTTNGESCKNCPAHSHAYNSHEVECTCDLGYYRAVQDDKAEACTQPPTAPRNLTITSVGQTAIVASWQAPTYDGGRVDLHYRVQCEECGNMVSYNPRQSNLLVQRVTISGLNPSTTYIVRVYAQNGVSQTNIYVEKSVMTADAVPAVIVNLRVLEKDSTSVTLAWDPPAGKEMSKYEVQHYETGKPDNAKIKSSFQRQLKLSGLLPGKQYYFKVRGETARGWSDFTSPLMVETKKSDPGQSTNPSGPIQNPQSGDNPIGIIAGSIVAVVVCMAVVIVMVIIFLRRNHRACDDKNPSECDALHYSNVPVHLPCPPQDHNGGFTVPLFTPPGGFRTYVDPHTYEDPQQAVREFTKEIDASLITIESVIGGGEFGDVCKGKFRVPCKGDMTVAIKTLKPGASEKNRLDFLTEASIMGQFEDTNVIYLEGVVTKSNPIMIVTEYMENGSLDTFLRNNDGKFTVIQLVGMMRGIACGMKYLSDMGYVHRDLAARNILVNDNLVCKVADFGLSREIEVDTSDGAYTTKGGKIPVRWTAPEAIAYRKFTSASDVWSYGVVMWEIMAYGERPYWNWSNQDVIKAVDKGYRLPPPMDCPEACHQLMLDCWAKERGQRPKFAAIVKTLDKLIRAPDLLRKIAKARPHNVLDPTIPDMTQFTSIEEWLINIKMERYIDSFVQAGYHSMEQVSQITIKDLISLGITLVGHQKKIMNSVQTLRAQLEGAQVSEGFLV